MIIGAGRWRFAEEFPVRIIVATTQVPFVRGGAEIHAQELCAALIAAGHCADIVAIPFKWDPPQRVLDHMLACRLLDLSETNGLSVDLVIGLKFPAYLVKHPNKVLWIVHQYRSAYDMWNSPLDDLATYPDGMRVREAVRAADAHIIPQARSIFCNSMNVGNRLKEFLGIDSKPLYHPPRGAARFYCEGAEDYLFFPSRIGTWKRQELLIQALKYTINPVRVRFCGTPDDPLYLKRLESLARNLGVARRIEWLGEVSENQKYDLFAHCLAVVYPPLNEDLGYVTMEAMLSGKPVITCADSGGSLEFVKHRETGLICEADAKSLAAAMDELWDNRAGAKAWGVAGRERYQSMGITWPNVIERLLG